MIKIMFKNNDENYQNYSSFQRKLQNFIRLLLPEEFNTGSSFETLFTICPQFVEMIPQAVDLPLPRLDLCNVAVTLGGEFLDRLINVLHSTATGTHVSEELFILPAGGINIVGGFFALEHFLAVLHPLLERVALSVEAVETDGILQQYPAPLGLLLQRGVGIVDLFLPVFNADVLK
jgi:hypothetical protein